MMDTDGLSFGNVRGADPDEDPFDMSNLSGKRTGLPFVVWISPSMGVSHEARVKVSRHLKADASELVTVEIRPEVRVVGGSLSADDFNLLRRWVEVNYDILVGYPLPRILPSPRLRPIQIPQLVPHSWLFRANSDALSPCSGNTSCASSLEAATGWTLYLFSEACSTLTTCRC